MIHFCLNSPLLSMPPENSYHIFVQKILTKTNKKSLALSTCLVADSISNVSLYLLVNVPWYSEGGKIPVTDSIYMDRNLSKCQPSRGAIILLYK